jgi:outer membrane protein OmpA-like peptidoglycan-associated protein
MNTLNSHYGMQLASVASLLLVACSSVPEKPAGSENVRRDLSRLQADSQLASRAPAAIQNAEVSVRAAEAPQKDKELTKHLVFMADRDVNIARSLAQARWSVDQRKILNDERIKSRLDARTREADMAKQQLADLNAQMTERGLMLTLGDMLFDTGRYTIKPRAKNTLARLAAFLNQYQDRTVLVEGHTDSVGSDDNNMALSQRRADAVKNYLVTQGVAPSRMITSGKGESMPVVDNNTSSGRRQNRRVEVIIVDASITETPTVTSGG